eukprot:2039661-Karenia_brevis.AAC.1
MTPVVEVTFVDDECIMLCASTPRLLQKAAAMLLEAVVETFTLFALEINWSKGKSEAMVKFRGDGATT